MRSICFGIFIFQLTTSRRGRQLVSLFSPLLLHISTHYLTQRQTITEVVTPEVPDISTHYLTQRQTLFVFFRFRCFTISTHYLTQRQTSPTTHSSSSFTFQLTTSRRGRPVILTVIFENLKNFNSLPHAEVDDTHECYIVSEDISTHYLTQRQTKEERLGETVKRISTHYLTQRQTEMYFDDGEVVIFQLTTSRRGRRNTLRASPIQASISTHYLTQRQTAIPSTY